MSCTVYETQSTTKRGCCSKRAIPVSTKMMMKLGVLGNLFAQDKNPIQHIRSHEPLGDMSSASSETVDGFCGSDHFGYASTRHSRFGLGREAMVFGDTGEWPCI